MNENRRIIHNAGLAIVSPLLALIYALRSGNKKVIRRTITIFSVLFASTFTMQSHLGDGVRHWERVYVYYMDLSLAQFLQDLFDILFFINNPNVNEDIYIHLLSYFIGGILGLPGLFFVGVGLVYGYFFAGSMVRVFDTFPSIKKHFPVFIIAVYFIVLFNLQSMSTVRTWTAFWILFYGIISYYQTGKKKYMLLIFLPPFFHFAYFLMAIPAWVVVLFKTNKNIITLLFILSFGSTLLTPQIVINQLNKFEVGQEKVRGYYLEEQTGNYDRLLNSFSNENRWYKNYHKAGIAQMAVFGVALLFMINGVYYQKMNTLESSLLSIGLLTKTLSNSTWFLFALANRSNAIAMLFVMAAIYLYWQRQIKNNPKYTFDPISKFMFNLLVIPILFVFVYHTSNITEYYSIFTLFFPFVVWINEDVRYSIREILGLPFGL